MPELASLAKAQVGKFLFDMSNELTTAIGMRSSRAFEGLTACLAIAVNEASVKPRAFIRLSGQYRFILSIVLMVMNRILKMVHSSKNNDDVFSNGCCQRTPHGMSTRRTQTAFTLVEILIVLTIIGILAAVALPTYREYLTGSESSETILELEAMAVDIDVFAITHNRFPASLAEIDKGSSVDLWGNPYRYLNFATVEGVGMFRKDKNLVPINTDYDLYSMGPDGQSVGPLTAKHSRDDIIRANNGGFYGIAEDY